jgi:hypothetical protein
MCIYTTICIIISIITVFSSNISSLSGICSSFSGNNAIFSRDNTYLRQNVDILAICKVDVLGMIAQVLQPLTPVLPPIQRIKLIQQTTCILLTSMAQDMQVLYYMKNKPIQKTRGV